MTQPATKQTSILESLRGQIIGGEYQPGTQLPTRDELEQIFSASRMTVQRVLDQLTDDGFVVARGRNGTYVTAHPPHLHRYGVVFPFSPQQPQNWSRFWDVMEKEARDLGSRGPTRVDLYYGTESGENRSYQQLVEDIQAQRLAGLFFASEPVYLGANSPVWTSKLPRVAIMEKNIGSVNALSLDRTSYIQQAVGYFKSRGRKKIGLLLGTHSPAFREELGAALQQHGLETRTHWTQLISPRMGEAARNLTHLLMHPDHRTRPDALLVADDHLSEYVLAGLLAAGVKVGDDVDVVMHCNFPAATPMTLPIKRLGYDMRAILQKAKEVIDAQRANHPLESLIHKIPAVFEEHSSSAEVLSQVA